MRTPLRLLVAVSLLAAGSLALGATAQAGVGFGFSITPSGNQHQMVFDFDITNDDCTDGTVVTIPGVPDAVVVLADPNSGTVSLPVGTPGDFYDMTIDCNDAAGAPISSTGGFGFADVNVEKVVTGVVPDGTTFAVSLECTSLAGPAADSFTEGAEGGGTPPLVEDLTFGAAGGSEYLVAYFAQDTCTITETDDGGATTSTLVVDDCGEPQIDAATEAAGPSGTFSVPEPTTCTQTFTNNFPDPAAQPADVIQGQPAFTG